MKRKKKEGGEKKKREIGMPEVKECLIEFMAEQCGWMLSELRCIHLQLQPGESGRVGT
jgi:hypothetical protein